MHKGKLKLLARNALLFNLSQKFRMISIDIEKNNVLNILIAITESPSIEEEALARTFADNIKNNAPELSDYKIEFLVDNQPIDNLPRKSIIIHAYNE